MKGGDGRRSSVASDQRLRYGESEVGIKVRWREERMMEEAEAERESRELWRG